MTKKFLGLSLAAVVVLAGVVNAAPPGAVQTRNNQHNQEANPWYGGYSHTRNSSTAEMVVCSGRCLLAAIIKNTGPESTSLVLKNTSVADGSGVIVFKQKFQPINTTPGDNVIALPILLDKGISVQLTSASNGEEVTVEYLDLD